MTEPCDHDWESLEDGSSICFKCDERTAPPLDLEELAAIIAEVEGLSLEEKLLGAPRINAKGVELAPGKTLIRFSITDDGTGDEIEILGDAIQVIRRDRGEFRLGIRLKIHSGIPGAGDQLGELWFAGDAPLVPAHFQFINQDNEPKK